MNYTPEQIKTALLRLSYFNIGRHLSPEDKETFEIAKYGMEKALEEVEPKPLTIEQIILMDGEPIYCVDYRNNGQWCLVDIDCEMCIDNECGAWRFEFYGMTCACESCGVECNHINGLHECGWLAYAHKPKGVEGK